MLTKLDCGHVHIISFLKMLLHSPTLSQSRQGINGHFFQYEFCFDVYEIKNIAIWPHRQALFDEHFMGSFWNDQQ
jgi:hypothetical protein